MKATLRLKIIGGFMVAVVAALGLGVYSTRTFSSFSTTSETSARVSATHLQDIADIEVLVLRGALYAGAIWGGKDKDGTARENYPTVQGDAARKLIAFGEVPMSPESRALYDATTGQLSWTNKLANTFMGLDLPVPDPSVPVPTIQELAADGGKLGDEQQRSMLANLGQLRAQIGADAAAQRAVVKADGDTSLRNLVLAVAAACVVLLAFGLWLSYVLVRRLRATVEVLDQVAGGDLTARFDAGGSDEVAQMGRALNASLGTVHDVISQIDEDADHLAELARKRVQDASVSSSPSDSSVSLSTSGEGGDELADMADNLKAMISLFVTRRDTEPAGESAVPVG